jgi:hypothetical protein
LCNTDRCTHYRKKWKPSKVIAEPYSQGSDIREQP